MDKSQLAVINQMRKIEGHPEMGWEQYQQATEFVDTDGDDDSGSGKKSGWKNYSKGGKGGSGGGSGGGVISVKTSSFGRSGASSYTPNPSVKVKKVARKARVRSGVSGNKIAFKRSKTV